MASSVMTSLANTSTQFRQLQLPNVKVSKSMPLNVSLTIEDKEKNQGFCIGSSMSVEVKARFGSSRGGAVLERPSFDQSQFDPSTQVQQGGDIGRVRDRRSTGSGDSYRVLLLDDERHTEKLVAKVLPQVVPSITPDDARRLFDVSRKDGVAVVIVTVKEHAEFYSQMMMQKGLRSSIEPDSNTV
ncbi:ATP-dependent Clp protease adapter protein CLPS2, chloroplastic-like [Silene latifolia]|uniref:ATP-dependent Clp protease adapter protein CLPS2, chloroplastic-like n=1 Tax=Silene latifolia TaxID=37657 RepID=UPI003D781DA7